MAQPLPQGSVRRVRGVSPTSDLQKMCGAEFSQAGKQDPVYTACEAVNQKSGTTLHCLPSCEGPHPEPPVQNPGIFPLHANFKIQKAEGLRFSGSPLLMNCSTMCGSDARRAPVTKWQAVETCTGSLIFADPPAGRIRKNCLLGEASPVPFETICDGGCKRSIRFGYQLIS